MLQLRAASCLHVLQVMDADIGGGMLRLNLGVGSIIIYNSCNETEAQAYAEEIVDNLNSQPVSVEITPIFN